MDKAMFEKGLKIRKEVLGAEFVEKALASTPFAETPLERQLVRTGFFPFALYQRFALQRCD